MMIQHNPIIVQVIQQPVESTTVGDVLIGAIGLTGVLVCSPCCSAGCSAAMLIGIKMLRRRAEHRASAGLGHHSHLSGAQTRVSHSRV